MRRRVRRGVAAIVMAAGIPGHGLASPKTFRAALSQGIVDFMFNPWSKRDQRPLIDAVGALKPGIINRLGFQYGGPTQFFFDKLGDVGTRLRSGLPDVVLGGGFPEALDRSYHQALQCDDGKPPQVFDARDLTRLPADDGKMVWIALDRPEAVDFYRCIGKMSIRRGFTHFHFEQGWTVVQKSASVTGAISGLRQLQEDLTAYAKPLGMTLSFSGDPELSLRLPLDAVYLPSRFYTDSFDRDYRNKVDLPSVEGGYTYSLSTRIVDDVNSRLPAGVIAMFYVDNFDARQDDLRRFMELTAPARRILITRSVADAARRGAVFIPPVNHCEGCIPDTDVIDTCEILGGSKVTEYDAAACGDFETMRRALIIQGSRQSAR